MNNMHYYTIEEVAERYRTSPVTIRRWRITGYLKGTRIGGRVLYSDAELAEFEAAQQAKETG